MIYYGVPGISVPNVQCGTNAVKSLGDGQSIAVYWYEAFTDKPGYKIAYNIYYSTVKDDVFLEGIKYVSIDGSLCCNVIELRPGQEYFFAVRPIEYDPTIYNLSLLPIAYNNIRVLPTSVLRTNLAATDYTIPLMDVEGFPSTGIIKIGAELIQYIATDQVNNDLILQGATVGAYAHFVVQSNDGYYLPSPTNKGAGMLNNLSVDGYAPSEDWVVRCIFVEPDGYGNPLPSTAKFEAIGSITGVQRDGYADPIIWTANGPNMAGSIISFSITETKTFALGDQFTFQTIGFTQGTNGGRGYDNTPITEHTTCGSDGYYIYSPIVTFFVLHESKRFDRIFTCQSRFEYPHYAYTAADGYKQVTKDILSTDDSAADAANINFPMYDYSGYHRTDPVLLLNGTCVGSYIGGQQGCIDQYGNYNIYRGLSVQDMNTQRQAILLSLTGQPAVLIKRVQTGIVCPCYLPSSEYPDDRCPKCLGGKFVLSYEQYFYPNSSDGRIQVHLTPTAENLKMHEAGLESEFPLDMWTLTVPTIHTRDVIVLFDQDDNESFRYEVSNVIRNNLILGLDGGQHLNTFRVRKYDPIYQIPIFANTSDFPTTFNTSISSAGGLPPHTHTIVTSEKITSVSQLNEITGISFGHSHGIWAGKLKEAVGHTHQIILPT
jgi:hypothetical protein